MSTRLHLRKLRRTRSEPRDLTAVIADILAEGDDASEPRPIAEVIAEAVGVSVDGFDDAGEDLREDADGASQVLARDGLVGPDAGLLLHLSLKLAEVCEELLLHLRVHESPRSSVADTPERTTPAASEGPFAGVVRDTAIRDTLARLADLIGDDYTVSVTWGGVS